jgi:hypothetical protein
MAGWTNRGKYVFFQMACQGTASPTLFYVALCTSASVPGASKNLLSDMVQCTASNGYTSGGASVARTSGGWDVITEDDSASNAYAQIVDIVWTAAGGNLPSPSAARYAVLLDSASAAASRQILAYWDLSSDRQVSDGQTLTLQNLQLNINEV